MINSTLVKQLRDDKEISQAELASRVGVVQQLIGQIERGQVRTTKAIFAIARELGVPAHVLDPDIPAVQGWAAKISEELNEVDDEVASHLLQNLDNEIQFAKSRFPKKTGTDGR
jgi:transcriptional regulator with XRE-family HTH domain